jgi:hypothetical protein
MVRDKHHEDCAAQETIKKFKYNINAWIEDIVFLHRLYLKLKEQRLANSHVLTLHYSHPA